MSIVIKDIEVVGLRHAITSMRNPMNSWDESDSTTDSITGLFTMGEKDHELAMKLVKAGTDHSKFMRDIQIKCQISAPLYWWKEMDTYKVSTIRNSCSTMHKILDHPFTIDDFAVDKMDEHCYARNVMDDIILELNLLRDICIAHKDEEEIFKKNWYKIIQLLPSSYIQTSSWSGSYQTLRNIYFARKGHKLDEWHEFCKMIESLPHSELITCLSAKDELIDKLKAENEELKNEKKSLKIMIDELETSNKNLLTEIQELKQKKINKIVTTTGTDDTFLLDKVRKLIEMLETKPESILIFDMGKVSNWSFNPGICHGDIKLTENEYVFQTNEAPYAFDKDDIKKILEDDTARTKNSDALDAYLSAVAPFYKYITDVLTTASDNEKCCENCRWGDLQPNPHFYPCNKCKVSDPCNWEPKKGGEE